MSNDTTPQVPGQVLTQELGQVPTQGRGQVPSQSPIDLVTAIIRDPLVMPPETLVVEAIAQINRLRLHCNMGQVPHAQAQERVTTLARRARASCIVVMESNYIVGLITERTLLELAIQQTSLEDVVIGDLITDPVPCLRESSITNLFSVINLLQQQHLHHLPILNEQDHLVGLITHESLRYAACPIDLLRLSPVSDVMTHDVVHVTPETSILEVAQQLLQHKISCIVIAEPIPHHVPSISHPSLTQHFRPIGILTERDVFQFHSLGLALETYSAGMLMSSPVFTVRPETSVLMVQQLMDEHFIHRIVVVGSQGELMGIVTQSTVLQALQSTELYKLAQSLDKAVGQLQKEKVHLLEGRTVELEQQIMARMAELEAKAKRETLLADLATQTLACLSIQTIMDTTVEQVRTLLGCDRVNVWQFDPGVQGTNGQATVVAESTDSSLSLLGQRIDTDVEGEYPQYFTPIIAPDGDLSVPSANSTISNTVGNTVGNTGRLTLDETTYYHHHLIHLQAPDKILVPLVCDDHLWGLLYVSGSQRDEGWHPHDVELLQSLSVQLAIAIQHATNYQRLQAELDERRQAQARQYESEQRYASLAAAIPVGIFRTDQVGNYTYVNAKYCQITGLSPDDVLETNGSQWIEPEDRDRILAAWNQCIREHCAEHVEYRWQRPDGATVWIECQTEPERNHAGHVIGYVGSIIDISERKQFDTERQQAEAQLQQLNQDLEAKVVERTAELQERESRYRALVEVIPDLLIRIQADGTYLDVIVGQVTKPFNPEQFRPGVNIYDVTPPDHAVARMEQVQRALQTGKTQFYEYEYAVDGTINTEEARIVAINHTEALIIVRNVSERAQLEVERKQAEAALQESERRFRYAIKQAPCPIMIHADDGEVLQINDTWTELTGYTHSDIPSTRVWAQRAYGDRAQEIFKSVIAKKYSITSRWQEGDLVVMTKNGEERIWEFNSAPLKKLPDGRRVVISMAVDVTERRRAENALLESEKKYRGVYSQAAVGFANTTIETQQILDANPRFCEMVGYSREELLMKTAQEITHPDDRAKILPAVQQLLDGEEPYFFQEKRYVRKDGSVFWSNTGVSLVQDVEGKPKHTLAVIRDISDRKQAQSALIESEARWQFALEGSGDGVWDWDVETNQVFFSRQWKTMLGYAEDEVRHTVEEWNSRIHPEDAAQCHDALKAHFEGNAPTYTSEHRLRCKDGTYKWILSRGKVIEWITDGHIDRQTSGKTRSRPKRIIGTHSDISDRKQAEIQIKNLIEGTAATTGQEFFSACVRHIAIALGVSHALITELAGDQLHVLAFWSNGALQPTFSFPFTKTPCEITSQQSAYFCEDSVQERFPECHELVRLGAESYLGTSLCDSQGNPIGTMCILHSDKMSCPIQSEQLLRVFAARAAAELERQQALMSLEALNQALETTIEQRTAELQEREARYRALMEGAGDGILVLDRQGHIVEANQKSEDLLGYSRAELATLHFKQIYRPESEHRRSIELEYITTRPFTQILDVNFHCRGNYQIPMDISTSVIEFGDETIIQVILRDIRDRKRAEQSLRESQQFIQTVIDTVPLPIAWKNRDSVFFGGNYQLAKLLHIDSVVDIIGKTDFDFPMTEADAIASRADDQEILRTGQPKLGIQETLTLTTGEQRWIETHKAPLKNWRGDVIGVVVLLQDITERKQSKEQLQRTNAELARATRLKDEFLANMSHELRTPLNAILGMAEGLQEQVFGPTTQRQIQALKMVERSGTHLLELINDILDIAKIESGHIELDIRPTPIVPLCQSCLIFVRQEALRKKIQLEIKTSLALPEIHIDERRIRQVLINLLNNAVKFTPENGAITLEVHFPVCPLQANPYQIASHQPELHSGQKHQATHQVSHPVSHQVAEQRDSALDPSLSLSQNYVRIAVTDTGIGLTPEHISRLFQPFIQIDSTLNRQYNGTGLGLALVKRITELHNGYVDVTSEFGVGSCFMVYLPCETAIATASPSSSHPLVPPHSLTSANPSENTDTAPLILLAEDNEANISTTSSYLKAKGYRIIVAKNGQEAIDFTQTKTPDLILMDVQMPVVDGLEAIRYIREVLLSSVPIIALTALAMESDRDRCLATGANQYLSKPVRLKHLAANIQQLLTQT